MDYYGGINRTLFLCSMIFDVFRESESLVGAFESS